MYSLTAHALITLLALLSLFCLMDPLMLLLPSMAQMGALLLASLALCGVAGAVVAEWGYDERDSHHANIAGRVSYLAGLCTLTIALCVQGLAQSIDIWIPVTLAVMVTSKLAARFYSSRRG